MRDRQRGENTMNRKHYSVIKNFLHILLATGLNLKPYNAFAQFFFIVFFSFI